MIFLLGCQQTSTIPLEANSQYDQLVSQLMNRYDGKGPPGISVAVGGGTNLSWQAAWGFANVPNQVEVMPQDQFGIGSITKTFVAVVALQLWEEGLLKASDTPYLLLGEAVASIPNAKTATLFSLLSHTSGIPSWEDNSVWIKAARGEGYSPNKIWSKAEPLNYVDPDPLFVPGKQYAYSNTNYTLLGLMIEKVTGSTLEQALEKRVFQPLGLKNTYLEGFQGLGAKSTVSRYHYVTDTFLQNAGVKTGAAIIEGHWVDVSDSNLSTEWAAGGMISNSADLLSFALALKNGHLLTAKSQQKLLSFQPILDNRVWVGQGIFMETVSGRKVIGHSGSVLGFTGYMGWLEHGCGVFVVLTNAGTMHTGGKVVSASKIALSTEFINIVEDYERTQGCKD